MSRAGVILLLLLGSGVAPVPAVAHTPPMAQALSGAVARPLAPELPPVRPSELPTPAEQDPGPGPEDGTTDPPLDTSEGAVAGDPLEVSITTLTPSTLPRRGTVTIGGRITNRSAEEWTDLTVYAATSATPITTEEELLAAEEGPVGVEPADYQRLVDPDLYEQVRDLGPGETTRYELAIPRGKLQLPSDPGVYRVGVQVLGTEDGGRLEGADGRARVLMTSVSPALRTPVALALQMRKRTVRTATGEVDILEGWERTLARQGRMRQVVRLLATAADYPVSLILDPAVVEAAGSLAEGNTGIDLGETTVDGVDPTSGELLAEPPPASEEPAGDDEGEESGESGETETGEPTSDETSVAADAISWLEELRDATDGRDVRAIPYGDLDLGAAARLGRDDLLGRSLAGGISLLSSYGVQATGIAAPYDGLLSQQTADALPVGVPILAGQGSLVAAVSDGDDTEVLETPPAVVPAALSRADGAPIWTFRSIRATAGSAAGTSALEMRQRILARSGIQASNRPGEPLLAVLPPQWDPGTGWSRGDFFDGLRAPWLRPVPIDELPPDATPVVAGSPPTDPTDQPDATDDVDPAGGEATSALALAGSVREVEDEVPRRAFRAARRLTATGTVLGGIVIADEDTVGPRVERQALLSLSVHSRRRPLAATGRLRAADNILAAQLRDVEVLAPPFVRMASENGSFLVPVVNGLDVPIRVQLRPAVAEPGLQLEAPEPVEVPAQGRQPIRVAVTAETIGIRSVRVDLVTPGGDRLYNGPTFSVRSSQVGRWVWVAMAVGSALLFVAIAVRIARRVRARRATHGPTMMRSQT